MTGVTDDFLKPTIDMFKVGNINGLKESLKNIKTRKAFMDWLSSPETSTIIKDPGMAEKSWKALGVLASHASKEEDSSLVKVSLIVRANLPSARIGNRERLALAESAFAKGLTSTSWVLMKKTSDLDAIKSALDKWAKDPSEKNIRWLERLAQDPTARPLLSTLVESSSQNLLAQAEKLGCRTLAEIARSYAIKKVASGSNRSALEDAAATKIQSAVRGRAVRKKIVFAREIEKFLRANLQDFEIAPGTKPNLRQMSKALAREILEVAQNPDAIPKEGVRLERADPELSYIFPTFNKDHTVSEKHVEEFKLPVAGLWISRTADGKGLELEMIGKKLGEGTSKDVFQSRPLRIDLQTVSHEKAVDKSVLVAAYADKEEDMQDSLAALQKIYTPQELKTGLDTYGKELRLGGLLTHMDRMAPDGFLEARDIEFDGDFDMTSQKMSTGERLQVLADAASTLADLHARGGVHGDVKALNILTKGEPPRGFVSDFDTLVPIGGPVLGFTPLYSDEIADIDIGYGRQTPFADIYALARTTARSFFTTSILDRDFNSKTEAEIESKTELNDAQKEVLRSVRNAISEVDKANDGTIKFLAEHQDVLEDLKSFQEPKRTKRAMEILNREFPAFQNFIVEIQKAQKIYSTTEP